MFERNGQRLGSLVVESKSKAKKSAEPVEAPKDEKVPAAPAPKASDSTK